MNSDRQKILTDYISYIYTTGRTYDTIGKYIKHVTDFLEMAKEVNRRGYLNYKRENADVMVRHSLMCSAICDLLSFLNIGYGKREKTVKPLEKLDVISEKNKKLLHDFIIWLTDNNDYSSHTVDIYYQEASLILAQAKKANFTPKYFGCDGMDGILALDGFDKSLAEDLMFLTPFTPDSKDDKTQTFVKAYKKAFKDTPIQFAADAYDCIYTIKAAAEKAKLTPDMSISDMSDALKKSMTEIELSCLTAKSIKWSADGEPTKEPTVVVVKNGAYDVAE